jgi:hypothetical protein
MKLYDSAVMLAGQFFLVLQHDASTAKRGEIVIVQSGPQKGRGVFIHPRDVPKHNRC